MAEPVETAFARSDDVDIAYQVIGDGPRDLVMTMGFVSHLDVMWELPELADFLEALARIGGRCRHPGPFAAVPDRYLAGSGGRRGGAGSVATTVAPKRIYSSDGDRDRAWRPRQL